jgi:hypothetical protein
MPMGIEMIILGDKGLVPAHLVDGSTQVKEGDTSILCKQTKPPSSFFISYGISGPRNKNDGWHKMMPIG